MQQSPQILTSRAVVRIAYMRVWRVCAYSILGNAL